MPALPGTGPPRVLTKEPPMPFLPDLGSVLAALLAPTIPGGIAVAA
ncbi:hypothetical protein ACFYVR_11575 [Rhodococcus sp. NPDC003318]